MGYVEILTGRRWPAYYNNRLLWLFHYWSDIDLPLLWQTLPTRLLLFSLCNSCCSISPMFSVPSLRVFWVLLNSETERPIHGINTVSRQKPESENMLFIHGWSRATLWAQSCLCNWRTRFTFTELYDPTCSEWCGRWSRDTINLLLLTLRTLLGADRGRNWIFALSAQKLGAFLDPPCFQYLENCSIFQPMWG